MRKRVTLQALALLFTFAAASAGYAQQADPRVGLKAGMSDAGFAARSMQLISHTDRPAAFNPAPANRPALPQGFPAVLGDILYANSDITFRGNQLFMGNFDGFQIYDVSNASAPKLVTAVVCPGGQGDLSVYKNLMFMSVEMPNGRTDCTEGGFDMAPSPKRFLGVRIFDISDVAHPKLITGVQTCRGSHTHTLVTDPKDPANVYIYVSGVDMPRSNTELAGCSAEMPDKDPNTSFFRIDVIKVPVAAPQNAKIVNEPRIFADSAGNIAGLWKGGPQSEGAQGTARTDQCHDITVFQSMNLAAGACSGNGILLDISDPANPKRVDQVFDPNFAYWHSATFSNDGSKVIYTDEWGGGMGPRCQATDRMQWGADAIFNLSNKKLTPAGYYKLPAPQSAMENCVAHNGSLVPVPGRDIMVQAWYQGGISAFDFTDPQHPQEIAFFDRGPYNADTLHLGGFWSAYWYNGKVYGSEIGRGLDILELKAGDNLTQNEIDAANTAHFDMLNPQNQPHVTWPASLVVAKAYVDQLGRSLDVSALRSGIDKADKASGAARKAALGEAMTALHKLTPTSDADNKRVQALHLVIAELEK